MKRSFNINSEIFLFMVQSHVQNKAVLSSKN